MSSPVFRFAPSPNGRLHLGHAYSALLNQRLARESGGSFLLRIDDSDQTRCTPELEAAMIDDLAWLGIKWDGEPRRQSEHQQDYRDAVEALESADLVYPAFLSRKEIRDLVDAIEEQTGAPWRRDPDGSPHYPGDERSEKHRLLGSLCEAPRPHALRLDMDAALNVTAGTLSWQEEGKGPDGESGTVEAFPDQWGDFLLFSKDGFPSYHLSCVVDDAIMGVTNVVRGRDLFWSTSAHRLLQQLLGLPVPRYLHHDLILDHDGQKLSKSRQDTSLADLRAAGMRPEDICRLIGMDA